MTMDSERDETNVSRHLFSISDKSMLPRERALKSGMSNLSDVEIMAILLGTGTKGKNVIDLSSEIVLAYNGHLSELMALTPKQITERFSGMGQSKALTLLAALELGRRAALDAAEVLGSRKAMTSSASSYEIMRHKLQNLDHEEFWVMLLNNSLKRITDVRINVGAVNYTIVEIRKVIAAMIEHGANRAILFHNHPSGLMRPSPEDDKLTRKIIDAAKIFDFSIVDHIIISPTGYFSYADEGRL